MTDEQGIFYDRTPALSHNAVITMCTGMRGGGKTFSYKEWCITDPSYSFVWVRRYDTELKKCEKTFLGDMIQEKVIAPESVKDWKLQGHTLYYKDRPKGYFIALSKQAIEKSGSFHTVDKIVFDECFLKPHGSHRYLNDEVEMFLELMETVNRLRLDGRREVRAVLIGNKTSYLNPWFAYYGIKPFDGRFRWAPGKKGLVLVENYTNAKFSEIKRHTKFGRLIDGTKYGDYVIENEAWFDDGDAFITKKPNKCQPILTITYHGKRYGVWSDSETVYIGESFVSNVNLAGSIDDMTEEIQISFVTLRKLKSNYENGSLRFRDVNTKFEILDMLQRYASLKR